jgi:predicted transcriptional regulator
MKATAKMKVQSLESFFEEGREVARLADAGKPIPKRQTISFERIDDLLEYLTPKRVALFEALKAYARPPSISDMARDLGRDRAAVKRDVDALCRLGILSVDEAILPGHGRQKLVRPVARQVLLTAAL